MTPDEVKYCNDLRSQNVALQAKLAECTKQPAWQSAVDSGMRFFIGEHWRTSLTGYASAAAVMLLPLFQNGAHLTAQQCLYAVGFAFLGRMAKDGANK